VQLRTARPTPHRRVPVGKEIPEHTVWKDDVGSIIIVVATDAPLIPTQLKRLARKASLGLGRDGSYSGDGSGDIFVAFSTANPEAASNKGVRDLKMLRTTTSIRCSWPPCSRRRKPSSTP